MDVFEINKGWEFTCFETEEWLPAEVPGCVHTDLLLNKKIEDPFYRDNEKDLQWIDKKDWIYKTVFCIEDSFLAKNNIRLNFKGLDTYADTYLNGNLLLRADNMFREWKIDCKNFLKPGKNELKIVFHSPVRIGLEKLERLGFQPPAVNDQSERGGLGENKVSVFTRKAPYHYGWDWGPRLVTCGIWRPVRLEAWENVKIENVFYKVEKLTREKAVINAVFEIISTADLIVELIVTDLKKPEEITLQSVKINKGINNVKIEFDILNPVLWWTNGLGEPYLYELKACLAVGEHIADELTCFFGIRTVKVVQNKDSYGTSFYIELNGVPVFMKGANYIPCDSFPARVTNDKYDFIVASAAAANMNMLRVWGGGIYEDDFFYDLCDKKGILVWQDFMFACSMYPVDSGFKSNIKSELADNIIRLRNHSCIAIWCGNNEILTAWGEGDEEAGWGWKQKFGDEQREFLWDCYSKIFYDIIPGLLSELDGSRCYWPSSPAAEYDGYNGITGWNSGDNHYWGVWHKRESFEKYQLNIGRFMSEYGFQSYPEIRTVNSFAVSGDLSLESGVMSAHQRCTNGNEIIRQYLQKYYNAPEDFASVLYLSQVLQAEGIKIAIEAHRTKMPVCMGSLYWQLNDCWPAASWSGIDYFGRWKALHYFARNAYKKIIVCAFPENDKISVYVVSDCLEETEGSFEAKVIDFKGNILKNFSRILRVKANRSEKIIEFDGKEILNGAAPGNTLLYIMLTNNYCGLTDNIFYFTNVKDLDLKKPGITAGIQKTGDVFKILLSTDYLAKNVCLSFDEAEGFFSNNFFDLVPGRNVMVEFIPADGSLKTGKLKITTVADTCNL